MRRLIWLVVLGACGGGATEPSSRTLPLGRYAITAPTIGAGTLDITAASSDSIAGVWSVQQTAPGTGVMTGPAQGGFYNLDAYVLYGTMRWTIAGVPFATTYVFRLSRSGNGFACTSQEVGDVSSRRACSLSGP